MRTNLWISLICCSLGTTFMLPAQTASDIRQGIVAYWPMDAAEDVVAPDLSTYGNHLSLNGMDANSFVPGRLGNAASFLGSASYLSSIHTTDNTATGLPIYGAGSYTIMMWVKGPAQTNEYLFTEGYTGGNNPLLILQTGSGANTAKVDVIIRNDAGTTLINHVASSNVVFDDTWHHIAWVDDRGRATLYVDGVADPANFNYTRSGVFSLDRTTVGTLIRAAVATGNIFTGLIDEVGVWERPLTQAEVQQVMANGLETPIPLLPPFVLTPPSEVTRNLGEHVKFTGNAVGTRPISYQWYKNDEPILDAFEPTLALYHLTEADSAEYTVEAANEGGITTSTHKLVVLPDPAAEVGKELVSYWPMEELPIDDLGQFYTPDLYSHNHLMLANADSGSVVEGIIGNGLGFNGYSQYGTRGSGFPVYNNSAFTVALWVNAAGVSQSDTRFFAESSTNSGTPLFTLGTTLAASASGAIRVYIRDDAGTVLVERNSTRQPLDGTWHHVVWTESNGVARLYIDGVQDETDFNYTRRTLTLNQTAVGAIVRTTVGNYLFGSVDELALWNRALTFTEVQEVFAGAIPLPEQPIPPEITQQPVGQSVLTGAKVSFTFVATGTSPLDIQWRKDDQNVPNETNAVLMFDKVQLGDAGDYTVVVANSAGKATSAVATLTVTLRPPPPTQLKVDFNHTGAEAAANTESGFNSFALSAIGPGPFKRIYGGAEVTLSGVGCNLESRLRTTPINSADFTEEKLMLDFIFARDAAMGQGLDVTVDGLEPNQLYQATVWSFDSSSVTVDRISDWSANGELVKEGYLFFGSNLPTDNDRYRFSFNTAADENGRLLIQGRRNVAAAGALNVFLNALAITRREITVQRIEIPDINLLRLTIEVLDPTVPLRIESKRSLSDPNWFEVSDVYYFEPVGNIIEAEFELPQGYPAGFFRVVAQP